MPIDGELSGTVAVVTGASRGIGKAIAIGYAGDPDTLPDDLREMELALRDRRPFGEFVFADRWGQSAGY